NGIGYLEIEGTIADARAAVRDIKYLENHRQVRGLLVRVESPGGGVTASHEIYSELVRVRDGGLPVVVSMGTLAASGGYYVSLPADIIVANPGTLTGSIGVIMEFPMVKGLMDKLGLGVEVIKSRANKDIGSPFRPMTDPERALLQDVVIDVYEQFVGLVVEERGLDEKAVRELADGRILTGRQALELGLVDTLGTLEDARRVCAEMAGLGPNARLIKPRRPLRMSWLDLLTGTAEHVLGLPRFPRLAFLWR
ncbi:signal peptide peptidase SppA, partial [candidate division WOR-3 bacterium]|nr:signal peptide peptidase SppA [candidate division WOR-3 bacterium]